MQPDSPQQRLQDEFLINLDQDWQCRWWSNELGVSPEQIRDAIEKVGPRSKAVRDHLDTVRRSRAPKYRKPQSSEAAHTDPGRRRCQSVTR